MRTLVILMLLAGAAWASSPAEAVAAAHQDCSRLVPADRPYVRYLSIYPVADERRQREWRQITNFWLNSLSRSSQIHHVVPVTRTLFRLDLRKYRLPLKVWEKLADVDPYFHADLEVEKVIEDDEPVQYETKRVPWEGGIWKGDGKFYEANSFTYEKKVPKPRSKQTVKVIEGSPAPWLDRKMSADLVRMTESKAPILRADWFLVQSGQQDERNGTGYFDFLEVKNRDDFDKLVALDKKLAEEKEKEVRAIIPISNVAINNRQVIRLQTINGGYWRTLDVERKKTKKENEERNAARNLNGDFVHDAEEIYGPLANGLFAFYAGNAKGVRQDSVPPQIASAGDSATGNDARIHPFTCVKCHREGIRPLDDWGRKVYKAGGNLALVSPDYNKSERLQRLYLSDLDTKVSDDQRDYARALFTTCGLKPPELSVLFGKLHEQFVIQRIGLDEAAREWGVTRAALHDTLRKAAVRLRAEGRGLDPPLAGLLQDPEEKMRRDHFEEAFAAGAVYLMGGPR